MIREYLKELLWDEPPRTREVRRKIGSYEGEDWYIPNSFVAAILDVVDEKREDECRREEQPPADMCMPRRCQITGEWYDEYVYEYGEPCEVEIEAEIEADPLRRQCQPATSQPFKTHNVQMDTVLEKSRSKVSRTGFVEIRQNEVPVEFKKRIEETCSTEMTYNGQRFDVHWEPTALGGVRFTISATPEAIDAALYDGEYESVHLW